MVRAKFQVSSVTNHAGWGGKTVVLSPQYDMAIPEDQRYAKATPSGKIEMTIDNPPAADQLKLGEFFYVDFTPVADVDQSTLSPTRPITA